MPKVADELSAVEVRRLYKTPGWHNVGGVPGLLLQVTENGACSWVLRATMAGRVRMMGLGPYPEVTLAQARAKAKEFREQIRAGRDPLEERKAQKRAVAQERAKRMTFKEAAERVHAKKAAELRSQAHIRDWIGSLERFAFPVIGNMPVNEIELPDVLKVLQPIWETKSGGTAGNVRHRMESVFTWAIVSEYRSGENPARWTGNLKEVLAAPTKIHKTQHRRAVPWQQAPAFIQTLRERHDPAAKALDFLILTAARSGEVLQATWEEIDFDGKLWTVPADRIKAGKKHRVPLSRDAIEVLNSVEPIEGEPRIFALAKGTYLNDGRLLQTARSVSGDPQLTVHGLRSTFKDWARSRTRFPDEVSELALAHVNSDATRAAYARDELLPQRAKLMQDWATFLREPMQAADVVSIGQAG